jgi:Zn-dependent peptidase ImmA (M78 family)
MMIDNTSPVAKARWVLETKGITGVPAESLTAIADSENIRYRFCELPEAPDLSGELLFRRDKKGIIINTLIKNRGRQNFTFAHELGHYFLGHKPSYELNDNTGFWCSVNDLKENLRPQEVEANRFAVELLMPEDLFRLDMAGAPIDFDLINSLSKKYQVSKHASSNRILDFVQTAYIIITTEGVSVKTMKCTPAAKPYVRNLTQIPAETIAHRVITRNTDRSQFEESNPVQWLNRDLVAGQLYECAKGDGKGHYMIILRW